jgi:predicted small lipoprotein YifL
VPKISYLQLIIATSLVFTLTACGRKGALEAPPGDMTPRVEAKRNTFFNTNAKIEKQKADVNERNAPLNPQLTAVGQVVPATAKTVVSSDKSAGVLPVGGGRKAKRILPPQDSFFLDPLL